VPPHEREGGFELMWQQVDSCASRGVQSAWWRVSGQECAACPTPHAARHPNGSSSAPYGFEEIEGCEYAPNETAVGRVEAFQCDQPALRVLAHVCDAPLCPAHADEIGLRKMHHASAARCELVAAPEWGRPKYISVSGQPGGRGGREATPVPSGIRSKAGDCGAKMRRWIVAELDHQSVALERGLHSGPLDAAAASMNQTHFAEPFGCGRLDVVVDDRDDVGGRECMQIELVADWDMNGVIICVHFTRRCRLP
jgi:hypothetical protein